MLKTHKSLLALALVPTLFAAQLTGLATGGTTPAAHASTTLSVTPSSLAPSAGSTLTITVNGVQGGSVTVAINAPNPGNAGTHLGQIDASHNGDTSQPDFADATTTNQALPNALEQTVTVSSGTVGTASFDLPSSTASGTYGVYAIDEAGDTGTSSFTVSSNSNSLLVNSGVGTATIPLGGQFSVYFNKPTYANDDVTFSLQTFGYAQTPSSPSLTPANTESSVALSGLYSGTPGAATTSVPLLVVPNSVTTGVYKSASTITASAAGIVQAKLQLSGTSTPILSQFFFDQVYTIVASTPSSTSTSGSIVSTAVSAYTVTEAAAAATTYTLNVAGATTAAATVTSAGPVATGATQSTQATAIKTALVTAGVPTADVNVVAGATAGKYTVVFSGADSADTLSVSGAGTTATLESAYLVTEGGNASTYTLTVAGARSGAATLTVPTASANAVATALEAVAPAPAIPAADLSVVGANGGPYAIVFSGADAADTLTLTHSVLGTTGQVLTAPSDTVTEGGVGSTYTLTIAGTTHPGTVGPFTVGSTTALQLQNALQVLSTSNVEPTVAGVAGGPYTITWAAPDIATPVTGVTVNNSVLGTSSIGTPHTYLLTEGPSTSTFTLAVSGHALTTGPLTVGTSTGAQIATALQSLTGNAAITVNPTTATGPFTIVLPGADAAATLTTASSSTTLTTVASASTKAYTITTASSAYDLSATNGGTTTTIQGVANTQPALNTALTSLLGAGNYILQGTASPYTVVLLGTAATDTLSSTVLVPTTTGGTVVATAAIKLDNSQSTLSFYSGTSLVAPNATTVAVSGSGWGDGANVEFYFSPLYTSFTTSATVANSTDAGYTSAYYLGSAAAGSDGTLSDVSVDLSSISSLLNASTTGTIVAEDVATSGLESGHRLNAAAFLAMNVSSSALTSGGLQVGSTTPAIGQTIAYTATGFAANSTSVTFSLGSATTTNGTTTILPPQVNATVDATGAAHGTFVLPESILLAPGDTVTATLSGQTAAGTTQTLTATLTIPSLSVTAIGSPTSSAVTVTGTGFWSGESVVLQYVVPGTVTPVALGSAITAGVDGTISSTVTPSTTLANGSYTLTAQGVSSGFIAAGILGIGGYLSVPTTVIPGQTVVISGTQFQAAPSGATASTLSVNFIPTPVTAVPINVDSTGAITATFVVPTSTVSGTYTLTANAYVPNTTVLQQRYATIKVVTAGAATLVASPTSASLGGTTSVTGSNFLPNETVNVALQYANDGLAGSAVPGTSQPFTASATGTISGTFTVKSTAAALVAGVYKLVATGATSALTASTPFTVSSSAVAASGNIFFAEGFTGTTSSGAQFNESISILNANNYTTTYTVTYFLENKGAASTVKAVPGTIGPDSVVEQNVNTDAGANQSVAAEVSSSAPLAATRIISRAGLDSSSSLGQQLDLTATGTFNYYLAAGEVQLTNEEYLTILNPNSTAANLTVTILPQSAVSSTTTPAVTPITITVPALSRYTEHIRADLVNKGFTKFGLAIASNVPVAAERVEYYGDGAGSGKYGATTKPAASSAFRQYIFAATPGTWPSTGGNAATGTGTDIAEVDIVNPAPASGGSGSATVTVSFFDKSGAAINSQQIQVDPGTRESVAVNDVVNTQADVFSAVVTSDKNVFVEEPTYFGGDPSKGGTFAVITPSGAPAGLTSVAFPYLDLTSGGSAISQTVYLYNPGSTAIVVQGVYAAANKTVVKTYNVAPNSVTAVSVNADASTLTGAIGGIFTVQSGTNGSFVALQVTNNAGFKIVTGDQGSYPTAASPGV